MALTYTQKLNLPIWGAGTDAPARTLFNAAMTELENRTLADSQGEGLGPRPNAGISGRLYTDTLTGYSYRDNGTAWVPVSGVDQIFRNSATDKAALSVLALAGTTANLSQWSARDSNGNPKIVTLINRYGYLRVLESAAAQDNSTDKNYVEVGTRGLRINRQGFESNEIGGPALNIVTAGMSATDAAIQVTKDAQGVFSVSNAGVVNASRVSTPLDYASSWFYQTEVYRNTSKQMTDMVKQASGAYEVGVYPNAMNNTTGSWACPASGWYSFNVYHYFDAQTGGDTRISLMIIASTGTIANVDYESRSSNSPVTLGNTVYLTTGTTVRLVTLWGNGSSTPVTRTAFGRFTITRFY